MKRGIYGNIENKEYRALPYLHSSFLTTVYNKSVAYYARGIEATDAMRFGTAQHCRTLEPDLFQQTYKVAPPLKAHKSASRKDKDFARQYLEEECGIVLEEDRPYAKAEIADLLKIQGIQLITEEQAEQHEAIHAVLMQDEDFASWMKGAICELSIISNVSGVDTKSRLDLLNPSKHAIVDLKVTADASPDKCARSISNFRYDMQAAFYIDTARSEGIEVDNFYFIFVERTPPYGISKFAMNAASYETGRDYLDLIPLWQDYQRGIISKYSNDVHEIEIKPWARKSG